MRALVEAGHAAPSADNLQPLGFLFNGKALTLHHRNAGSRTFPMRHPATLMAVGAALENVLQAAAAMEIQINISELTGPGSKYAQITMGHMAGPPFAGLQRHALFARHTNRLPYRAAPIPDALIESVAELCERGARIQPLGRPAEIRELATLTRIASEARFRTQEIHAWFAASLRMTAAAVAEGDGLDVRTFDLPPGGRRLLQYISAWHRLERLNRFGAYRFLAAIEAKPIRLAPLLIAIIADDPVSAGRLMERTWIELNARGLAVQPYYVIPDQIQRLGAGLVPSPLRESIRKMADNARALLRLSRDETLQMVLRVGWPTHAPVRSLRLPLDRVLSTA